MSGADEQRLVWHIERYLEYRAVRLSANSLAAYRADLQLLARTLAVLDDPVLSGAEPVVIDEAAGRLEVPQVLTIDRLAAAFARIRAGAFRAGAAGPRADASVRRIWASANTFCARLVARRVLSGNPMAGVDNAAVPQMRPRAFTTVEADAVITAAGAPAPPGVRIRWPARDVALVLTGLLAGLRAGELLSMTVGALRPSTDGDLFVQITGKGGKDRTIPVAARLRAALEEYMQVRCRAGAPGTRDPAAGRLTCAGDDHDDGGFGWGRIYPAEAPVFVSVTGAALSRPQLGRIIAAVYTQAGIATGDGIAVHALRHTFATGLHEHGASAFEIQRLLGHVSPVTTQRYIRTSPSDLRPLVDALSPAGG